MAFNFSSMWHKVMVPIERFVGKYARGGEIHIPDLDVEQLDDGVHVRLAEPIRCFNWPFKPVGKKNKNCHIFVQGEFTCEDSLGIDGGHIELNSYVTMIAYYKPIKKSRPKEVVGLDGYHFDMDEKLQIAHPVFHMQRKSNLLDEQIAQFKYTVDDDYPRSDTLRQVRVPTPQFDVMSALLMIIADHLVTAEDTCESDFLRLVDQVHERNKLKAAPSKQAYLCKCEERSGILPGYWYAPGHRPETEPLN